MLMPLWRTGNEICSTSGSFDKIATIHLVYSWGAQKTLSVSKCDLEPIISIRTQTSLISLDFYLKEFSPSELDMLHVFLMWNKHSKNWKSLGTSGDTNRVARIKLNQEKQDSRVLTTFYSKTAKGNHHFLQKPLASLFLFQAKKEKSRSCRTH